MTRAEEILASPDVDKLVKEIVYEWPKGSTMAAHEKRCQLLASAMQSAIGTYAKSNAALCKTLCYYVAKLEEAETKLAADPERKDA